MKKYMSLFALSFISAPLSNNLLSCAINDKEENVSWTNLDVDLEANESIVNLIKNTLEKSNPELYFIKISEFDIYNKISNYSLVIALDEQLQFEDNKWTLIISPYNWSNKEMKYKCKSNDYNNKTIINLHYNNNQFIEDVNSFKTQLFNLNEKIKFNKFNEKFEKGFSQYFKNKYNLNLKFKIDSYIYTSAEQIIYKDSFNGNEENWDFNNKMKINFLKINNDNLGLLEYTEKCEKYKINLKDLKQTIEIDKSIFEELKNDKKKAENFFIKIFQSSNFEKGYKIKHKNIYFPKKFTNIFESGFKIRSLKISVMLTNEKYETLSLILKFLDMWDVKDDALKFKVEIDPSISDSDLENNIDFEEYIPWTVKLIDKK